MQARKGWLRVAMAATVTAIVVLPVAIASGQESGATASKAKANATAKKIKTLNTLVKSLSKRVEALEGRGGPSVQLPNALPPNGPAGGDLTGSYPRPLIGQNTITAPKIAENAVGISEISDNAVGEGELAANSVDADAIKPEAVFGNKVANGSLTGDDIQNGAIGSGELSGVEVVTSEVNVPGDSNQRSAIAFCPAGSTVIAGGFEWSSAAGDVRITRSMPFGNGWQISGLKTSGATTVLFAKALCLK